MGSSRVDVVDSRGCSKLFIGIPNLQALSLRSVEPMSPASSSAASEQLIVRGSGPFSGLVICVTGLSKEARQQVMAATERLGGQYSATLHPQCTHLVVQTFGGRKFEHALKHGLKKGLFIVTLGWFVDSVRRNVRLGESLYSIKSVGGSGLLTGELNHLVQFAGTQNTCIPTVSSENNKPANETRQPYLEYSGKRSSGGGAVLARQCIYVDSNISTELQKKVVEAAATEGAIVLDNWFIGCNATHVVCEGHSILRYLGHTNNLVTPLWILKTQKEKQMQRLVHMSADLARQVGLILENVHHDVIEQNTHGQDGHHARTSKDVSAYQKSKQSLEEKQHIADLAKMGIRARRGHCIQLCQTSIRPITPSILLESICWSISEPTSTARVYTESAEMDAYNGNHSSEFFDAEVDTRDSEASFNNFSRSLRESEKSEVVFKNHFLTLLFPVDRFGEMGPSSRTFFRDTGFTCLQVLDHIYAFYQENMSADEVGAAIHTDSRHADWLRSIYASKESLELGYVPFKRIDFLGSRRSFEMLKRVSGDNSSNVYELLIRA